MLKHFALFSNAKSDPYKGNRGISSVSLMQMPTVPVQKMNKSRRMSKPNAKD
jgi:hypothetical protein